MLVNDLPDLSVWCALPCVRSYQRNPIVMGVKDVLDELRSTEDGECDE